MDNETTVILEKLKFRVRDMLSREFLDMQFKVDAESFFLDRIIVSIRGSIWSTQYQHVEIEYPRDWWQAFKERWFGGWLLRRWPVEYKRHVLDIKALYPNFRPAVPDQEYRLRIFHEEEQRRLGRDPTYY
jgi:hypothetical protein